MKMDRHQSHSAAGTDNMLSGGGTHSNKLLQNQGAVICMILQLVLFFCHPYNLLAAHTFPAGPHGVKVAKHIP